MKSSESDQPVPLLTTAERMRLRPSVDTVALERFLAAIPAEVRPGVQRAVVLHFSRDVTMADIRDFLEEVGSDDAAEAMGRAMAAGPADLPKPEIHPPTQPGGLAYEPIPTTDQIFTMEPPKGPRLRALWDAIEPPRPASG
jgi:hypothetical protein